MDSLENELRALLLKKTEPKYLAQLYLLLDSVRTLADTIEAEIEDACDVVSSSESDDSDSSSDSDSDASFTKEERKLIRSPEQYAFLKRYSLVPK